MWSHRTLGCLQTTSSNVISYNSWKSTNNIKQGDLIELLDVYKYNTQQCDLIELLDVYKQHKAMWSHRTLGCLQTTYTAMWSHRTLGCLQTTYTAMWSHRTLGCLQTTYTAMWSHRTLGCLQITYKVKVCFYIAQYPVCWTAQSALHFSSTGRPVHSYTNSASPGSILARQQLHAKTKSLTFPPASIARYSFIQLSGENENAQTSKR